ncbi:MAG: hypothetical protein DHS80DRAFT_25698 [Piptocephalis tieghemiana]|nr:MAG: hypothetical protein DHS80DRAFT_25698 [Piptocephalis tieghemiana]
MAASNPSGPSPMTTRSSKPRSTSSVTSSTPASTTSVLTPSPSEKTFSKKKYSFSEKSSSSSPSPLSKSGPVDTATFPTQEDQDAVRKLHLPSSIFPLPLGDSRDRVFLAVIRTLLALDNEPCSTRDLTNHILKHGYTTLGGSTPAATVSSRISQHYSRAIKDSRSPILERVYTGADRSSRHIKYRLAHRTDLVATPARIQHKSSHSLASSSSSKRSIPSSTLSITTAPSSSSTPTGPLVPRRTTRVKRPSSRQGKRKKVGADRSIRASRKQLREEVVVHEYPLHEDESFSSSENQENSTQGHYHHHHPLPLLVNDDHDDDDDDDTDDISAEEHWAHPSSSSSSSSPLSSTTTTPRASPVKTFSPSSSSSSSSLFSNTSLSSPRKRLRTDSHEDHEGEANTGGKTIPQSRSSTSSHQASQTKPFPPLPSSTSPSSSSSSPHLTVPVPRPIPMPKKSYSFDSVSSVTSADLPYMEELENLSDTSSSASNSQDSKVITTSPPPPPPPPSMIRHTPSREEGNEDEDEEEEGEGINISHSTSPSSWSFAISPSPISAQSPGTPVPGLLHEVGPSDTVDDDFFNACTLPSQIISCDSPSSGYHPPHNYPHPGPSSSPPSASLSTPIIGGEDEAIDPWSGVPVSAADLSPPIPPPTELEYCRAYSDDEEDEEHLEEAKRFPHYSSTVPTPTSLYHPSSSPLLPLLPRLPEDLSPTKLPQYPRPFRAHPFPFNSHHHQHTSPSSSSSFKHSDFSLLQEVGDPEETQLNQIDQWFEEDLAHRQDPPLAKRTDEEGEDEERVGPLLTDPKDDNDNDDPEVGHAKKSTLNDDHDVKDKVNGTGNTPPSLEMAFASISPTMPMTSSPSPSPRGETLDPYKEEDRRPLRACYGGSGGGKGKDAEDPFRYYSSSSFSSPSSSSSLTSVSMQPGLVSPPPDAPIHFIPGHSESLHQGLSQTSPPPEEDEGSRSGDGDKAGKVHLPKSDTSSSSSSSSSSVGSSSYQKLLNLFPSISGPIDQLYPGRIL